MFRKTILSVYTITDIVCDRLPSDSVYYFHYCKKKQQDVATWWSSILIPKTGKDPNLEQCFEICKVAGSEFSGRNNPYFPLKLKIVSTSNRENMTWNPIFDVILRKTWRRKLNLTLDVFNLRKGSSFVNQKPLSFNCYDLK